MLNIHFLFGIFGNITALILFLVPLITFWKIIKSKSTEQFSGFPYVSTLLNCLLSAWYGMPFVSSNNLLMSTVNGTGAVIEFFYAVVFICYIRDKKYRGKIFGLFVAVLSFFAMVVLVSLLAMHGEVRRLFCGFICAIFSICMYGSPLSVMRLVIKTKSVKYMPFFLSLFVFLCGTSWFIFGLLGNDPFVYVPNGSGSALGALQLILYVIYKDWKNTNNDSATSSPLPEKEAKVEGVDQMSDVEKGSYGQAKADGVPASQVKVLNGNHTGVSSMNGNHTWEAKIVWENRVFHTQKKKCIHAHSEDTGGLVVARNDCNRRVWPKPFLEAAAQAVAADNTCCGGALAVASCGGALAIRPTAGNAFHEKTPAFPRHGSKESWTCVSRAGGARSEPDLLEESQAFQIQVNLSGKTTMQWARATDLVQDLLQNLERRLGIPSYHLRLLYKGKQLMNTLPLSYYNIQRDASIVATFRLRGGSFRQTSSAPSFSYKDAVHKDAAHSQPSSTVGHPFEAPKPFLVDKSEKIPPIDLSHPGIDDRYQCFAESALICRFNGLWPRTSDLYQWIHKQCKL